MELELQDWECSVRGASTAEEPVCDGHNSRKARKNLLLI